MKEQQQEIINLIKEEIENKKEYFLYDFQDFKSELTEIMEFLEKYK